MQEIKKTRIVLASILKPVDDTRMFEKMGMSLLSLANVEVHIIGFPSVAQAQLPAGITLHPLPKFTRLSFQRMLAPWKVVRKVLALKPSLFMITTHELLPAALVVKVLTSCRVIYDVRENYFRNILHTTAFPKILRPVLAAYVRLMEFVTSPFIDHFFLAEKGYAAEMNFPERRRTIIENKVKLPTSVPPRKIRQDGSCTLLFSGTLAESTGVFVAIRLASALHQVNPSVSLILAGYAAQQHVLKRLREEIKDKDFIRLIGGDTLVPHTTILQAIQTSDAGIIAYLPNPATENSIPTKLYEYLGLQLPILVINHAPWVSRCEPYQAAIPFDADAIEPRSILHALQQHHFYTTAPDHVSWEHEEKIFLTAIKTLL